MATPTDDDLAALGKYGDFLREIASNLLPEGPAVDYAFLVDYVDGELDEAGKRLVERHVGTWRAWYNALIETMAAARQSNAGFTDADQFEMPWAVPAVQDLSSPEYARCFVSGFMAAGFHAGSTLFRREAGGVEQTPDQHSFEVGERVTLWRQAGPARWFIFTIAEDALRFRWGRSPADLHPNFECEFYDDDDGLLLLGSQNGELTIESADLALASRSGCDRIRWRALKAIS